MSAAAAVTSLGAKHLQKVPPARGLVDEIARSLANSNVEVSAQLLIDNIAVVFGTLFV